MILVKFSIASLIHTIVYFDKEYQNNIRYLINLMIIYKTCNVLTEC